MLRFGLVLVLLAGSAGAEKARVGKIDFFGTVGVDVQKIRSVLPIRGGEQISEDESSEIRDRVNRAIDGVTGHTATDVAFVCCDSEGNVSTFIGLGGRNTKTIALAPAPQGSGCLSTQTVALYKDAMAALAQAIAKGNSGEDDSHGYALSEDPTTRAKQMALHEYAMTHEQELEQILRECREPQSRQAAAAILGYAQKSSGQMGALVRASRDPDHGVRNNALRALWVLASANPNVASEIPTSGFIEMLNSGIWTDRNKAGQLLAALTARRNPKLLEQIQKSALASLIEMAQWRDSDHAYAYLLLLGRIAGFSEARIRELIGEGRVDEIIAAVKSKTMGESQRNIQAYFT